MATLAFIILIFFGSLELQSAYSHMEERPKFTYWQGALALVLFAIGALGLYGY